MPALFKLSEGVKLPVYPERTQTYWQVVLVCDCCDRVQDGFAEDASEEHWAERARYLAEHCLLYRDVWWCHTICYRCKFAP